MLKRVGFFTTLTLSLLLGINSRAQAGFISSTSEEVEDITFAMQDQIRICLGGTTSQVTTLANQKVFFLDPNFAPAEGLRVRIFNVTEGFRGRKIPYSDREYEDPDLGSEKIILRPSDKHRTKTFSVIADLDETIDNLFRYRIYDSRSDETLIEGNFVIPMTIEELPPATIIEDSSCNDPFDPPIVFPR